MPRVVKYSLVALVASGLVVGGLWVYYWATLFAPEVWESVPAPASAPYRVEVDLSFEDVMDPIWLLYVRQNRALLGDEWRIGCFHDNGDEAQPVNIRWMSSTEFTYTSRGEQHRVRVDPKSGRPRAHREAPDYC